VGDWPRVASADPTRIAEWWTNRYVGYGIGILTGAESGLLVVDVDSYKPGAEENLDTWCNLHGSCPVTPMALTPSGGRHLYFAYPGVDPDQHVIGRGVDVQARGRYVVAPPSRGPSGRDYEWEASSRPSQMQLAEIPDGWLAAFTSVNGTHTHGFGDCDLILLKAGFTFSRADSKGVRHYARPGKEPRTGTSASTYPFPDHHCVIWSTSVHGAKTSRPYFPDELAAVLGVAAAPLATETAGDLRLTLATAASVPVERQRWLWRLRVPLGGAAIVAGQEGLGKSLLAVELASRASVGELDGDLVGPVGVVYASAEDAESSVLVPRFKAAGANLGRVYFPRIDGMVGGLSLPRHLPDLVATMRRVDAHLLVLDPFSVHLGGERMDAHRERDVRGALAPVAAAMAELDAAAIGIMHWNKAPSLVALDRVLGSRAFTAAARSVLGVGLDPDDADTRLVVVAKSNFAPVRIPALSYTVEERCLVDPDGGAPFVTAAVRWTGERTGVAASDLLRSEAEEDGSALAAASSFLTDLLLDGPVDSREVERGRTAAGISARTLGRARRELELITEAVRDDKGRLLKWTVRLP
jgi:hypothetical protein